MPLKFFISALLTLSSLLLLAGFTAADPFTITPASEHILLGKVRDTRGVIPVFHGLSSAVVTIRLQNLSKDTVTLRVFDENRRRILTERNITDTFETTLNLYAESFFLNIDSGGLERPEDYDANITIEILPGNGDQHEDPRQVGNRNYRPDWTKPDQIAELPLGSKERRILDRLRTGVVRLQTPLVPSCSKYDPGKLRKSVGCTSWRVSDDIFATNWHCLPEHQKSCDQATITFDYEPPLAQNQTDSTRWGAATEVCKEIVYSNPRLDFTLFRVGREQYSDWKDVSLLRVLQHAKSYPKTVTKTQVAGDRLAMIHFPAPGSCPGEFLRNYRAGNFNAFGDKYANRLVYGLRYQTGQRMSVYNSENNSCRVWVVGNTEDQKPVFTLPPPLGQEVGNIPIKPSSNHNPSKFCDKTRVEPANAIAILHRCDACGGSSGSALISLDAESGRLGTVVALHTGVSSYYEGYYAIRMSKITECVDLDAVGRENKLIYNPDAGKKAVCKAEVPVDAPHLACSSPDESDCRFYVE